MFKQKDYAALILVVAVSFVASFFLAGLFINTPEDRQETVLDVSEISSDTPTASPHIFHELAINPSEDISVGDSSSDNPFNEREED